DGSAEAGGKGFDYRGVHRPRSPGGRVENLDPAVIEVAEEVRAPVFRPPGQVRGRKGRTDDAGRRIMVNGTAEARVGFRSMLDDRPAVIGAGDAFIDFLRDATDVVHENAAGFRLDGEGERIATSQRPDCSIFAGGLRDKRVVVRD